MISLTRVAVLAATQRKQFDRSANDKLAIKFPAFSLFFRLSLSLSQPLHNCERVRTTWCLKTYARHPPLCPFEKGEIWNNKREEREIRRCSAVTFVYRAFRIELVTTLRSRRFATCPCRCILLCSEIRNNWMSLSRFFFFFFDKIVENSYVSWERVLFCYISSRVFYVFQRGTPINILHEFFLFVIRE